MASALKRSPQKRYTWDDYQGFPDNERWEIINGEAFCMSPAPTPNHQGIVGELFSLF